MDNKGFEKEESDSDNSVLPNAVSDSETDSSKNAKPRKVSKSDVNIYSGGKNLKYCFIDLTISEKSVVKFRKTDIG